MALVTETCLTSYFSQEQSNWGVILPLIQFPELQLQAFLQTCMEQSYILTLTGYYGSKFTSPTILQDLGNCITQLQKFPVGREHNVVALWILYLRVFCSAERLQKHEYQTLFAMVQKWEQTSGFKTGMFTSLVSSLFGKNFSAEFRLLNSLLATFVLGRILTWSNDEKEANKEFKNLFNYHVTLSKNKNEPPHCVKAVECMVQAVREKPTLDGGIEFAKQLVLYLYPSSNWVNGI